MVKIVSVTASAVLLLFGWSNLVPTAIARMDQNQKIEARIKPTASVCVEGQPCAAAAPTAAAAGPREGKAVYEGACIACHSTGVLGAPKAFDVAAWKEKLAKGFDATLANALKGINAMPPKGACADCSDEEIAKAIHYMSK